MRMRRIYFLGWTAVVLVLGIFLSNLDLGAVRSTWADNSVPNAAISEGNGLPAGSEVVVPDEYRHDASAPAAESTRTLYYFPLDSNNHNTLLFFYNSNPITATIDLDYRYDTGSECGSGVIFDIAPGASARVSADSLDAGRPSSWANTIIYNAFDTCEIGLVTMPSSGVQIEGYVAWTPTDTYNPRELNPHAQLRFSTDPNTVFMPTVSRTQ